MEFIMGAIAPEQKRHCTILIVEDHEGMRQSMRKWLGSTFEDTEFFDASTGEAAVELCKHMKPDLVVMDIKLPGINGIEATKQIKKILPETKVIMLTIYDVPAFQAGALEVGASAFISKNTMYTELIPAIEKLMA